jgi:putative transposase
MHLAQDNLYHVFNRGNNKQRIFLSPGNYPYFLQKVQEYLLPACDLIAYCLMPNHFHFLVYANERSIIEIKDGSFPRQLFSQSTKQLLSSYTKAINKKMNRTGSLFQQKTKAICVTENERHAETVFHYIHQNPMKAGLVSKMEDWEYSSFNEYLVGKGFCNQNLARRVLEINFSKLYEESYQAIRYEDISYPINVLGKVY